MRFPVTCLLSLGLAACSFDAFADGEGIFKQQCASCHGNKGQGMQYVAPSLKGSEFLASAGVDEIKSTIRDGRAGDAKRYPDFASAMPPFPQLSDEELTAVAEYVKTAFAE